MLTKKNNSMNVKVNQNVTQAPVLKQVVEIIQTIYRPWWNELRRCLVPHEMMNRKIGVNYDFILKISCLFRNAFQKLQKIQKTFTSRWILSVFVPIYLSS